MVNLERTVSQLDRLIQQHLVASNSPGLAFAATDREGLLQLASYGYADAAARQPLTPATLFDIASIGKWLTAVALLQQHEAGRLDLHAPIATYLPWFTVRSRFAPITAHHLLSHTSGLAAAYTETPGSRFDAAALRDVKLTYAPGARFHYSNTGYKVLGLLLEAVSGRSRAQVIAEGIYTPLDMGASVATVSQEWRARMAVGYTARYDDRPERRATPPLPTPWVAFTTGDGGGLSTASDLAAFARMILNQGEGPHGPILSPLSVARMTRPIADQAFDQAALSYGYGVIIEEVDGHTYLGHGGGTTGYQSVVLADRDAGLAVVALINYGRGGLHLTVARQALRLLRAACTDAPLLDLPTPGDPTHIEHAATYAGRYRAPESGAVLVLRAHDRRLLLDDAGECVTLEGRGNDTFYVDHPAFDRFLLRFGRINGQVVEALHGCTWYINQHYSGPLSITYPAAWDAYPGHYRSHNPWTSNLRVVLRKGALLLVDPSGGEQPLSPLDDGIFRLGPADHSPERVCFDTVVEGQALRLTLTGEPYYRALTA